MLFREVQNSIADGGANTVEEILSLRNELLGQCWSRISYLLRGYRSRSVNNTLLNLYAIHYIRNISVNSCCHRVS